MQKLVQIVLSAWREAERIATEHAPGSREHEAATAALERLKEAYAELTLGRVASFDDEPIESGGRQVAEG